MSGSRWLASLVAVGVIAVAGCARVSPVAPQTSEPPPPAIEIGTDGTPTMSLVAALYAAALEADGQPATVVDVVPGTETLALADHSPVAMPVYAASMLRQFNAESAAEPSGIVAALATAVAPELSVLETSKVDGGLVWAVTMEAASSGVADLTAVGGWSADKVVAAPAFALTSPSGVPALEVAYGTTATIREVEDAAARHDALLDGTADAAGFRRTETLGLSDLVELDDPMGVVTPDPLVVLLAADLADQRPDAVLVLDAVQQSLTPESFSGLTLAARQDGTEAAVADWLEAAGLAG